MDLVARYKEIIASGLYTRVRYRNIRGIVTDHDIRFLDPDGIPQIVINPEMDNLFGVFDERWDDIANELIGVLVTDEAEYFY